MRIAAEKRTKDMTTDLAVLSMNLAGAAVGGAATKTLLAAISAGVTGTNSALDKNFFYDMALPSLIAQMNADRTEAYQKILSGMQRETTGSNAYLWTQAVRDLVDYYNAGTLQHAAFSISKDAGAKQTATENQIEGILMVSQVATNDDIKDRKALTQSLNNISDANLDKVKSILVPLSKALSNLPKCAILVSKGSSTMQDIKLALQDCIQDVSSESNRSFKDDNAEITKRFKEAGILQ